MRIRQLQTFCDLARTLNFTQTAQRLHYAQSSVVEQIDALENHFGVTLFSRDGRRLALTDEGRQLLDDAEQILAIASRARARFRAPDTAPIVVMAPETFCVRRLPRILREYQPVDSPSPSPVRIEPASRAALATAVAAGHADVAVMLGMPNQDALPPSPDGVETCLLGRERLVLVVRAAHPLGTEPVTLRAVAAHPVYATETGCAYRAATDEALRPLGWQPAVVSGSIAALVEAVAATDGIALLPEMAVEDAIAQQRLMPVTCKDKDWPDVPLIMTWRRSGNGAPIQRFVALAQECFAGTGR